MQRSEDAYSDLFVSRSYGSYPLRPAHQTPHSTNPSRTTTLSGKSHVLRRKAASAPPFTLISKSTGGVGIVQSAERTPSVHSLASSAEIDGGTDKSRRRRHLTSHTLCEQLALRGLGDPRLNDRHGDDDHPVKLPKSFNVIKWKIAQYYELDYHRGLAKRHADRVNSRAVQFCKQQKLYTDDLMEDVSLDRPNGLSESSTSLDGSNPGEAAIVTPEQLQERVDAWWEGCKEFNFGIVRKRSAKTMFVKQVR